MRHSVYSGTIAPFPASRETVILVEDDRYADFLLSAGEDLLGDARLVVHGHGPKSAFVVRPKPLNLTQYGGHFSLPPAPITPWRDLEVKLQQLDGEYIAHLGGAICLNGERHPVPEVVLHLTHHGYELIAGGLEDCFFFIEQEERPAPGRPYLLLPNQNGHLWGVFVGEPVEEKHPLKSHRNRPGGRPIRMDEPTWRREPEFRSFYRDMARMLSADS
ncbi:MAG: hypothetical protein V1735_05995 [Nanoarchaeota archaeon]